LPIKSTFFGRALSLARRFFANQIDLFRSRATPFFASHLWLQILL
jgi:hypothetical protein